MFYRPFALRDHVTSLLWKWILHDFAFEKRLVGHILNKIVVIWFFQTRTIFLKWVSSYLVTWRKCALSIFGIRKIQTDCLTEALVTWPGDLLLAYSMLWKIKITPIYYRLHVEILFPFCALPIAPSLYCVFHVGCVHFPVYFFSISHETCS